jgi:hypothetical protein
MINSLANNNALDSNLLFIRDFLSNPSPKPKSYQKMRFIQQTEGSKQDQFVVYPPWNLFQKYRILCNMKKHASKFSFPNSEIISDRINQILEGNAVQNQKDSLISSYYVRGKRQYEALSIKNDGTVSLFNFLDDKLEGEARSRNMNGTIIKCHYVGGIIQPATEEHLSDGSICKVNWVNGKKQGYGTIFRANGTLQEVVYKDDHIQSFGFIYQVNNSLPVLPPLDHFSEKEALANKELFQFLREPLSGPFLPGTENLGGRFISRDENLSGQPFFVEPPWDIFQKYQILDNLKKFRAEPQINYLVKSHLQEPQIISHFINNIRQGNAFQILSDQSLVAFYYVDGKRQYKALMIKNDGTVTVLNFLNDEMVGETKARRLDGTIIKCQYVNSKIQGAH